MSLTMQKPFNEIICTYVNSVKNNAKQRQMLIQIQTQHKQHSVWVCGRVLNYNFRCWQKATKTELRKHLQFVFFFRLSFFDDFHFGVSLCTYFAWIFDFKFVIVFATGKEQTNKNIKIKKNKRVNLLRSAKWLPNKNKTSRKLNYMASKTNTKLGAQNRMKSKKERQLQLKLMREFKCK